jgi:hypothetical protein
MFNHGSGGSRKKSAAKAEVINLFGNNATGTENRNYIITEGVGGKGGRCQHCCRLKPGPQPPVRSGFQDLIAPSPEALRRPSRLKQPDPRTCRIPRLSFPQPPGWIG